MSQRRKSGYRATPASAAWPERGGRSSFAKKDAGRRQVTFAIVVGGMLIAAWILISSMGAGQEVTGQATSAAGSSQAPASDAELQKTVAPYLDRVQKNPSDQPALVALGNAYYDAGRWPEAIDWYGKALELTPENTDIRTDMGTAYFYSGNSEKAKEEWLKVLDLEPNKIQTHYNLGILYTHADPPDLEAARKEWETVVRIAPDSEQGKSAQSNIDKINSR